MMKRRAAWTDCKSGNADARHTNEVMMTKKVYGVEKRAKIHSVHEWDCRPISKRIINPNKARCLRKRLCDIQQQKIDTANNAIYAASTVKEIKMAFQAKAMIQRYRTSGYLQLLDGRTSSTRNQGRKTKEREAITSC